MPAFMNNCQYQLIGAVKPKTHASILAVVNLMESDMNQEKIFEQHIKLVEKVNNAKTRQEEINSSNVLYGFRRALELAGVNQLMECDLYYIDQGVDRPMCCGVFLDNEVSA